MQLNEKWTPGKPIYWLGTGHSCCLITNFSVSLDCTVPMTSFTQASLSFSLEVSLLFEPRFRRDTFSGIGFRLHLDKAGEKSASGVALSRPGDGGSEDETSLFLQCL